MFRNALLPLRITLFVAATGLATSAYGQCAEWLTGGPENAVDGTVYRIIRWDPDGPGPLEPSLVIGGDFTNAGGVSARSIARFDGTQWSPIGLPFQTGFGAPVTVRAFAVLPNGDLIAAGRFDTVGGQPALNIARWDGVAWHAMGAGLNREVNALTIQANGDLLAAGTFNASGAVPLNGLARWSGTNWLSLGNWSGSVGKGFTHLSPYLTIAYGSGSVAVWDGTNWYPLTAGLGLPIICSSLLNLQDNTMIAAFSVPLSGTTLQRWNGVAWMQDGPLIQGTAIPAITQLPDGGLVLGGNFHNLMSEDVHYLARLDGTRWTPLGGGVNQPIETFFMDTDGTLLVGGSMTVVDGRSVGGLARWRPGSERPHFVVAPAIVHNCQLAATTFTAGLHSTIQVSFSWQVSDDGGVNWASVAEGTNPGGFYATGAVQRQLTLSALPDGQPTAVRVVVSNACGSATSPAVTVIPCRADADCDGDTDSDDIIAFFSAWEQNLAAADFDLDSDIDSDDVIIFFNSWDSGC